MMFDSIVDSTKSPTVLETEAPHVFNHEIPVIKEEGNDDERTSD